MEEAFERERYYGEYRRVVRQIRRRYQRMSVEEMAEMFGVTPNDCRIAIDLITAHPDWDDEKIAETVDWED